MKPHAIALLGFTSFELSAFESFFRLAARREPGYQVTDNIAAATLVVVNADDLDVVRDLMAIQPKQPVLMIGASAHGTGWPLQPRPIKLMSVLTAMEQMLSPAPKPAAARPPSTPEAATPRPRSGEASAPAFAATDVATQPLEDDGILVVDDSDTALRFMQNRLRRFGFSAELVRSGEEALQRLARREYRFVFLDVMMEGMDGYQTCRAIKQRKPAAGGKPPVVVMLTSRSGAIDKVKGTLAGCDAYLAKPLTERDLALVLTKFDVEIQRGFQPTTMHERK